LIKRSDSLFIAAHAPPPLSAGKKSIDGILGGDAAEPLPAALINRFDRFMKNSYKPSETQGGAA